MSDIHTYAKNIHNETNNVVASFGFEGYFCSFFYTARVSSSAETASASSSNNYVMERRIAQTRVTKLDQNARG